MTRRRLAGLLVCAALVFRPGVGFAQLAGQTWLSLAPDASEPAAALESIPAPDPARLAWLGERNADYVDLLQRSEVEIAVDGNVVIRMTLVRRFLRNDAASTSSNIAYTIRTTDEDAVVLRAYSLGRDRKRTFVEPSSIQVTTPTVPRVFSDARDVTIPLPAVGPGTTAIVVFEVRSRAADWPLPWSSIFPTESIGAAERIEVDVSWAPGVRPPKWSTNDVALRCVQDAQLHCEKGRTRGIDVDPDMDSYLDRAPTLAVTTADTWAEVASRVQRLVDDQLGDDDAVSEFAKGLVRGKRSAAEKVEALHRFVSDEIRYVGLEHGGRAVVPENPGVTLERRYGDCKGKVALIIALARAVGITAHPVLATSGHYDPAALLVPATSYFDHMIACFPNVDGAEVCVDPTVPGLPAVESVLPRSGGVVLDLQPSVTAPRRLAGVPHAMTVDVDEVLRRDCEGAVRATETRRMRGLGALYYREMLRPATPGDRQRILNEEYREASRSVQTRSWTISDLEPGRPEVSISSELTIAAAPRSTSLQELSGIDMWLVQYGLGMRSANAHHPLRKRGFRYASRVEVHLCQADRPRDFGAQLDLRTEFGRLSRTFERIPDGVVVSTILDVPTGEVPVDRLGHFARFLDGALDQASWWVGLPGR